MSQKFSIKEEQSTPKEASKSPSSVTKEEVVVHEGKDKEEISVPAPLSSIRSPTGASDEEDFIPESLINTIQQSRSSVNEDGGEKYQLEQGDSNSSSNPPPLVLPPLDTQYDDSFMEMVSRAVNRYPRLNIIGSQQLDSNIDSSQKSFESILNINDDENSNAVASSQNKENNDDEKQVEKPRRALSPLETIYSEEDPLLLDYFFSGARREESLHHFDDNKSNKSTPSPKRFFVLRKNPVHVNDLDYVAKSQPAQSPQEVFGSSSQRSVISNQSKLEVEKKSVVQQVDLNKNSSQSFLSSQKDFSSWLYFDTDSQLQKFKDTIASEESPFRGVVNKNEEEESYQLCSSQEEDEEKSLLAEEKIFSGNFDEDSFSIIDIEKHMINMSTPKRDIVTGSSTSSSQSPREEASTSAATSLRRYGRGGKTRSGIIYNSLTPEAVRIKRSETKGQQQQEEHDNDKSTNDDLLL